MVADFSCARIGIAGAGGLGSNVAMHLVRSGVKHLVIADFDVVSESNLNRQFYFADQLGMPKTGALAANLGRIAAGLELELHCCRVTAENALPLFGRCSIVVEAFDDDDAKEMLIRTLLAAGKTVVAASGMAGIGRSNSMRVRRLGSRLYLAGDGVAAVGPESPPYSPRVGLAAALEANTVLALLAGTEI